MKTIVLPGYSSKNKEWMEDTVKKISGEAIEWEHWNKPEVKWSPINEANRLKGEIGEQKFNVIAKSLGTLVLMKFLSNNWQQVEKVILCGIPIEDMHDDGKSEFKILSDIKAENILVFQNSEDTHGSFEEVRRFLSRYNPYIKIVEKPGSTHDYPYFDEFKEFLG